MMALWRQATWLIKGIREFTRSGYESASKSFNNGDFAETLNDRHIMVTGANSGIGKVCALEAAKKGATVHLVCRSEERGKAALEEIKNASGNDKVKLHLLDMAKVKDVINFAKSFVDSGEPLNVLVNNAGCMVNERTVTADGFETNFATNTLATYALTEGLIPLLSKSKDPRVIVVSSGGMLVKKLDLSDMQFERMRPFDGTMAYAQNKRQQVIMVEQWANKYEEIRFYSMHPGWADTPAVQSSMPDFHAKFQNKLRTPEQGADTIVWLVGAKPEVATQWHSGAFFQDRKETSKHLLWAFTQSSSSQDQELMSTLEGFRKKLLE